MTHQWIKKAVLLYFRTHDNRAHAGAGGRAWFDKVPLRFDGYNEAQFREGGFRVVPPATVRTGAFIGRNVVLMPSYVNIGAYVDEGTMVDTWATVGSCAQIGKNVHLSGGVGIGGVLEPLQANPTIIEDNCFIGARSEIVEGVIVEAHSVISMGVFIGQSTKIYDRATGEVHYGRVPSGSVVVPGQPALGRRQALAVVRGHRQARGRRHARQDVHQRAAARLTPCTDIDRETLDLAKQLIACRSITPDDGGCLELIAARLTTAGFACERIDRGPVRNLWARRRHRRAARLPGRARGRRAAGPVERWTSDPFTPTERDGCLFGRGAADMKTSVAAMVTAAERFVAGAPQHRGSLALLLTSDEEGAGVDGTAAVVRELQARGERIDACIVGEPTSAARLRRHDQERHGADR